MLSFQRRWDLDLIKIMSSGVYCVEAFDRHWRATWLAPWLKTRRGSSSSSRWTSTRLATG
jgi:hypothetical protein